MSVISDVSDIAQAVGNTAVVASLLFLYGQLRTTRKQADDTREAQLEQIAALRKQIEASEALTQGQNVFGVVNYLERSDHLAARRAIGSLKGKSFETWSTEDLAAADTVARIYQVAAAFQNTGVLPEKWLHIHYGGAMLRAWAILSPYVFDLRERSDPVQRRDFEAVCEEIRALGWFGPNGKLPQLPRQSFKIDMSDK